MANARWVGGAVAVKQLTTITIANTWATNDTVSVTIANKTLTVTIGSAFATADVAAALAAAINAADATTGLVGNETRNFGGQQIPEFVDVIADAWVSGAIVYVRSVVAGTPFTMTASESTVGTGTATAATPTAATGPNHADNAANYAAGTLPVNNDVLFFDQGAVDCLYGLGYFRTNTRALDLVITNDWTGRLGLPAVNDAGYPEYRQRYFDCYGTKTTQLTAGLNGNIEAGALHLDYDGQTPALVNLSAARSASLSEPSVSIAGGAQSLVIVKAGNIAIEPDDSGTTTAMVISSLVIGVPSGNNADLYVTVGLRATWGGTLDVQSGNLTVYSSTFTLGGAGQLNGGVARLVGRSIGDTLPAFDVRNGATLKPILGSECGNVIVYSGGTLDCREALFGFTTSNGATAYPGAKIYDPAGLFLMNVASALLTLPGGSLNTIEHQLPAGRIVDMTASA